jgi:RNA polymerase sigma factor (sigma-70 family)
MIVRSDARLARRAADGDQRAFAAIYERYHQELYRYCRAILGDPNEAQDALQSTMASALRSLPGEERAIELRPWLYRVAHNEAVSIIRRRQPAAEHQEPPPLHEPGAESAFESRERLRALVADLRRLPERQRSALVMRELSGLKPDQIAGALGVTAGAARQLVYEARQGLQDFAEGRAMECDQVRRVISDGDGRVLRGRRLRAHLRGCEPCSDFKAGIDARTHDLRLIAPPLSAVAASGVLSSVLGGSAASGGLGALAGGLGGGAFGAKALGLIAASAAIGVGAGTVADVDILPGSGSSDDRPAASSDGATPASGEKNAGESTGGAGGSSRRGAGERAGAAAEGKDGRGKSEGRANSQGPAHAAEGSAAGGASVTAPAGSGQPEIPPGSGVADTRSGGHSRAPSTGPPEHAGQGPPPNSDAALVDRRKKTER